MRTGYRANPGDYEVSRSLGACAALLLVISAGFPAISEEEEVDEAKYFAQRGIKDKFKLSFGGYRADFRSTVQLNSQTLGVGTSINIEDTFGMSSWDNGLHMSGYFRFSRYNRIDFGLFALEREGINVLEEDIQFGDEIFPAGTRVGAVTNWEFLALVYSHSLVNNGKVEGGVSVGLSFLSADFDLATRGLATEIQESEDVVLPIPVIGVYASHTLRPKLFFNYHALFFALNYDKYSGSMVDFNATLDWYPFKHLGFGTGFISYKLDVEVDDEEGFDGFVDYEFKGWRVYASIII